jgi:hypothetical protein
MFFTSGQDAIGFSPGRARPQPNSMTFNQFACNNEGLPTKGAELSIDHNAVVIYHGTLCGS